MGRRGSFASDSGRIIPAAPLGYEPHWPVWAVGDGGGNHTEGDAVIGSRHRPEVLVFGSYEIRRAAGGLDQFLNVMLDLFVDGRCGVGGTDHPPLG